MEQKTKEIKSDLLSSNSSASNKSGKLGFFTGAILTITAISAMAAFSKTSPSDETILKTYSQKTAIRGDCMPKQKEYLAQKTQQDTTKVITPQTGTKEKIAPTLQQIKAVKVPQADMKAKVTPTLQKIKNDVDKIMGSGFCTDQIAKTLSNAPTNISWNLSTLIEAKKELDTASGVYAEFVRKALSNPTLAAFLVQDPPTFIHEIYEPLQKPIISRLLKRHIDKLVDCYAQLVPHYQNGNHSVFVMFSELKDSWSAEFFMKHGDTFGSLLDHLSFSAVKVLEACESPVIQKYLAENADQAVDFLGKMNQLRGGGWELWILRYPKLSTLAVNNQEQLLALAKSIKYDMFKPQLVYALNALYNSEILYACFKGPQSAQLIDAFGKISNEPGGAENLLQLEKPAVDVLFVNHMEAFVAAIHVSGYPHEALGSFNNPIIAKYLDAHSDELVDCYGEVAKNCGPGAQGIISNLQYDSKLAKFMTEHRDQFIQIVRSKKENALKELRRAATE